MSVSEKKVSAPMGEITLYTITNAHGASVELSSLGAGIVKVTVPDAQGNLENVALGYANPADYLADGPCAGKTPGRYANRIALGKFSIDGHEYTLATNNGPNALHGGPTGFANRIWHAEQVAPNAVAFTYSAADGEEGYPGNLTARVTYTWSDDNALTMEYEATADAKTVINLTNHAYFNLDGADAGSILGHKLQIHASHWLPTDATQIPTGEIADVKGTPMDFTVAKEIGRDIHCDFEALKIGKGYDHCWVVDNWHRHEMAPVCELTAEKSGRKLTITSTQPGVQVYTGNWLAGSPLNNAGRPYQDYEGVAMECQGFPDAPNKKNFPSQLLGPNETYRQAIRYHFHC